MRAAICCVDFHGSYLPINHDACIAENADFVVPAEVLCDFIRITVKWRVINATVLLVRLDGEGSCHDSS